MKRLVVVLVLVTVALAACGADGDWVRDAYTASGDATDPDELTPTQSFKPDDDLNVVVTLNSHNRKLQVAAVFTDPNGATYPTDMIELDRTVGKVLLGLDFEQSGATWVPGTWQVAVHVDEPRRDQEFQFTEQNRDTTLRFEVQTPPPPVQ